MTERAHHIGRMVRSWGKMNLKGSLDFVLGFPRLWEKSRDIGFSNSSTQKAPKREVGDKVGWYGKEKSYAILLTSHLNTG